LDDVYTPDVRRTTKVPPIVALVFVDVFDYMTLTSALLVFNNNVRAGTLPAFSVFKSMNTITALFPYNYVE
jgi:hypothetical protein